MTKEIEILLPSFTGVDTSSIGPQWPPQESSFDRIKGIDNRAIIRDKTSFCEAVGLIKDLRNSFILSDKSRLDRLSVRLFVQNDVWMKNLDYIEDMGDVVIPLLNTSKEFNDVSILYLGANSPDRQPNQIELDRCLSYAQDAMQREALSYREIVDRVHTQGYRLATLRAKVRATDNEIIDQMHGLYERFGWNRDEVIEIMGKETNIIAVAFEGEKIISAGIAETSMVNFKDGNNFRMAEITEAATDSNYKSKGLYSAVAAHLMHELALMSTTNSIFGGSIDLVFGECNGNEPGVLKAVRSLGRTFAKEISDSWHLPFRGYLPQHVPIAGAPRSTKYNDLFPTFMAKREISRFIRL